METIEVVPWFETEEGRTVQLMPLEGTDIVAYSWGRQYGDAPEWKSRTKFDLLIWHDCPTGERGHPERKGWVPFGASTHELLSVEPLTLSPSLYYNTCCMLHGFITDGRWLPCL